MALRELKLTAGNRMARALWRLVWVLLFRPTPRIFHGWRRLLLRIFGAKLARHTYVYPSVQVWAPWNLRMGEHSALDNFVNCYCVATITIGDHVTVSQYSNLCTASHDYNRPDMPLVVGEITIEPHAWLAADVFVGPGMTIGEGAVVAARSTVTREIPPWCVAAGAPAMPVAQRDRQRYLNLP